MSYIASILIVVLGVLSLGLAFKLLKGLVKTAVIAALFALILCGATFAVLYQDYTTFQDGLDDNAIMFITYEEEKIAAVNITAGNAKVDTAAAKTMNTSLEIIVSYEALDLASFQYKGRSIDESTLETVLEASSLETISDELDLRSDEHLQLMRQYDSAAEFQSQLAIVAATQQMEEEPNRFLLRGLRDGTVEIRPELLTMRFIEYVPDSLVNKAFSFTA